MCTALTFTQKDRYFGRTLDLEYRYSEEVVITPRKYTFSKKSGVGFKTDFAIIGIATVKDNYPLYYDAINEHGLAMAGLNFVENAKFTSSKNGYYNLLRDLFDQMTQYEFMAKEARDRIIFADTLEDIQRAVGESR
jgi:choloylglycine hydrolase